MEVLPAQLDEEAIDLVSVVSLLGVPSLGCKLLTDLHLLVKREQVWHLTTVQ